MFRCGPGGLAMKIEIHDVDRSEEHTSELQSRQYLHSFPTRRSFRSAGGVAAPGVPDLSGTDSLQCSDVAIWWSILSHPQHLEQAQPADHVLRTPVCSGVGLGAWL